MCTRPNINQENVTFVILAGGRDFGRCALASKLPPALWPVLGRPALQRLLEHLSAQSAKKAVICSNGDAGLIQSQLAVPDRLEVSFLDEALPAGTAGCIRGAISGKTDGLIVVLHGGLTAPPGISELIETHKEGGSELTVMLEPSEDSRADCQRPAEIYVCEPSVLGCIPEAGYFDLKEGLIPAIVRKGGTVHSARLSRPSGGFRNRAGYLAAMADLLETDGFEKDKSTDFISGRDSRMKAAATARIDPSSRVYGSVVIMDNSRIDKKVIIIGPAVIGRNVSVGEGAIISESVLWDDVQVAGDCEVSGCVVDYNAQLDEASTVAEQIVVHSKRTLPATALRKISQPARRALRNVTDSARAKTAKIYRKALAMEGTEKAGGRLWQAVGISSIAAAFAWCFWPQIADLWQVWLRSDEYSSGLLVPLLAVYVLWVRRAELTNLEIKPGLLAGLALFTAAQGLRFFGLYFMYDSAEKLSLVVSIWAAVLMLWGWRACRKVWPVMIFLLLMLPWPHRIQAAAGLPLQRLATSSAVFSLEAMGYPVVQEGNTIHIEDISVAVAEACNGLRMITAFFVVSGLVVLVIEQPLWKKAIVLASSLPIAILCNTTRLTVTALAFTKLNGEQWEQVFHDFGGYAMVPLALAAVVLELQILTRLTVPPQEQNRVITRKRVAPVSVVTNKSRKRRK